ncbi:MAG TPA: hypothetical protein VGK73_28070 [Polyangiaceae bacterium]
MKTRGLRLETLALGLTSLSLITGLARAQEAPPSDTSAAPAPIAPAGPAAAPSAPADTVPPTPGVTKAAPAAAPPAPAAAKAPTPDDTAAAAAKEAEADAASAAAEAEALAAVSAEPDVEEGSKLQIYGFADFTYGVQVKRFAFDAPFNSFALGRLNLYMASDLGDRWKALAEVRFSYLPHGATTLPDETGQSSRIDDTVPDYTDLDRPVRWGGIMIERAYLEYLAHPLLNVRAGHFLTPYGIWNVDHGSPVIIGVRRPYIVGEQLFPSAQTGLEIYGTHHFDPVRVGYHLTLSNGRGPIDTYQDLNENKAIGGRLFASADTSAGNLTLGVSGYTGRYTDATQEFGIDANGDLTFNYPIQLDYNELSLAADIKYELGGLLVQGETVMNDVVYDQQRPVQAFAAPGTPPGYVADYRRVGVYGLAGYRFPFLGTMPFAGLEYADAGGGGFIQKSAAFWGGLNVRPTARVVLKAQYTYSWFPDAAANLPENSHYNSLDFQAAWSF